MQKIQKEAKKKKVHLEVILSKHFNFLMGTSIYAAAWVEKWNSLLGSSSYKNASRAIKIE